jgi:hypothetical protein
MSIKVVLGEITKLHLLLVKQRFGLDLLHHLVE